MKAAGIEQIVIVLGYKREMFQYLKDKYNVELVFNPLFNIKNNIASILCAKQYLKNTYLCVSDCFYMENPFHTYEYQSSYVGYVSDRQEEEMYAFIDEENKIIGMSKAEAEGNVLLGHCFWNKEFSEHFIEVASEKEKTGEYDKRFWEWLVKDHLESFPDLYFKEYKKGEIFEFDYFEQLRQFDRAYVSHSHSDIIRNIKLVFRCDEEDIMDFRTVEEGMTNTSFIFKIDGTDYIYRHPGDGTENIINRKNEKNSLIKAKAIGIDPTYIYMDVEEGWKISKYITHFREPDYADFEDSKKVISVLRKLHSSHVQVDYGMQPWEDSLKMEKLLKEKDHSCFAEHEELKKKISSIYHKTIGDGIKKCFCHGDTYKPNWMILDNGDVILIDWEYSGFSDPGIDIGYYIVDAMYKEEDARKFIREYLGNSYDEAKEFHFMAYVAIIAYYWFVWAMYRQSCGADTEEALKNWHFMAKKYADLLSA